MRDETSSNRSADHSKGDLRRLLFKEWGARHGGDAYWTSRWLIRSWTPYLSWVFIKLGVSANGVTLLSAVVFIAGAVMLALPWEAAWIVGSLLVVFYHALDHCDGEVARYYRRTGQRPAGRDGVFWDSAVHGVTPLLAACLAFRLYLQSDLWLWPLIVLGIDLAVSRHPWNIYCETLIGYFADRNKRGASLGELTPLLRYDTSVTLSRADQPGLNLRNARTVVAQTLMFPGYFFTLPLSVLLDVFSGPFLVVGTSTVYWQFVWLVAFVLGRFVVWVRASRMLAAKLRAVPD